MSGTAVEQVVKMNGHAHLNGNGVDASGIHAGENGSHVGENGKHVGENGSHVGENGRHVGENGALPREEEDSGAWGRQFLPPPLKLKDQARALKVCAALREAGVVLGGGALRRVAAVFESELRAGLAGERSSLQCENTYVPELPDGTEEGLFLALDLGGTNFRVLLLELDAGCVRRQQVQHYHIGHELRMGPGAALFEFLADCVQDFVRAQRLEHQEMSLGFTFSFPMKQHSISSGELTTWTKSFKCSGMEGVDVAALLQRCLRARRLRVTVRVLLNDTTGTLVAGAMDDPAVKIGVILGTGSNGCYMERAARVAHWEAAHERVHDVAVDVEWGAFGDNGCLHFIRTDLDLEVDARSLLVNSFTFEKYIGGKYLGDLLTVALERLAAARLLPAAPRAPLSTAQLSLFEEENERGETSGTLAALRGALGEGAALSADDALVAQHAARVLSSRAAQLVSVCISVLLRRIERATPVSVAVDGSVFKKHPRIRRLMQRYIALLAPDCPFQLTSAEDGSGKGSALTAAIAARLARRDQPVPAVTSS